jgi:hypothetical protein
MSAVLDDVLRATRRLAERDPTAAAPPSPSATDQR